MKYKLQISSVWLAAAILVSAFSSCKKEAGEGGTSEIQGRVLVYRYDLSLSAIVDTLPVSREDVYLIYGANGSTYDDDFKTSYDGTYKFSGLNKGQYRLFAYSKDTTGLSSQSIDPARPKIPVFVDVTIEGNKSTVTAPDIVIYEER